MIGLVIPIRSSLSTSSAGALLNEAPAGFAEGKSLDGLEGRDCCRPCDGGDRDARDGCRTGSVGSRGERVATGSCTIDTTLAEDGAGVNTTFIATGVDTDFVGFRLDTFACA